MINQNVYEINYHFKEQEGCIKIINQNNKNIINPFVYQNDNNIIKRIEEQKYDK